MYSYRYFEKILGSLGYKDDQNICEFWFAHLDDLRNKVNQQMKPHMNRFGLEIRWRSPIGLACNEAVREYMKDTQKQRWLDFQSAGLVGSPPPVVNFEFSQFQFHYGTNFVSLEDFVDQFPTSKCRSLSDFRGINLTEISLQHALINNVNFAYANFKGSNLDHVTLRNVNLVSVNLKNSCILNVTLAGSGIPGADLRGAFINGLLDVNDTSVVYPFMYEPVSALYLIRALILSLFKDGNVIFDKVGKHTRFLANDVSNLRAPDNKVLRRYIDWYQYVFSNLPSLRSQSIKDKLFFSLSIVTTKAWSSYASLAVTGLVINLLFALMFYIDHSAFNGLDNNYFSAFYYSVVTFTTLGYGDITPQGGWARFLVLIEVVLGYVTLGVFVYLLSRKVSDKF